jgi:hypothetical protein
VVFNGLQEGLVFFATAPEQGPCFIGLQSGPENSGDGPGEALLISRGVWGWLQGPYFWAVIYIVCLV